MTTALHFQPCLSTMHSVSESVSEQVSIAHFTIHETHTAIFGDESLQQLIALNSMTNHRLLKARFWTMRCLLTSHIDAKH